MGSSSFPPHPPESPGTNPPPRRGGGRAWRSPNTSRSWWSAPASTSSPSSSPSKPLSSAQFVDQDSRPQSPGAPPFAAPKRPLTATSALAQAQQLWTGGLRWVWRQRWLRSVGRWLVHPVVLVALLLLMVGLGLRFVAGLRFDGAPQVSVPGAGPGGSGSQSHAVPSATPRLPTPTPTPTQTELDGVITIQNLDAQNPFEGDVQVTADNGQGGKYECRNAPMPNSTWHIILGPGATTNVPCILPVSSPASLPAHTFTAVETGQNGQGKVLIDNPAPFTGTSYQPTP